MNFDFSDDQHDIKRTARDLLTKRSTWERVRAASEGGRNDDELWTELCSLGWPGIAVGEQHGGQGLGTVELVILLEELGYACAVTPFLGSALAGVAIQAAGSDAQRERWLPGLASGDLRGALGDARDGAGELVPDAAGADVVVLVEDGGLTLLEGSQADVEPVDTIDQTRRYANVRGEGEALTGDAGAAIDRCAVAVSAELVGLCQRAMEMGVAYVKDRKQFDTPVGAYQAVSHRCAQMLRDTESARSTTYYAGWAADSDPARLAEAAAVSKAASSDAGREVTASNIQVHGGIGFTWEADAHWLFKRAQMDSALLGGAGAHRAKLARHFASRISSSLAAPSVARVP